MRTAAAGRRTDGGRWPEATRSVTAIRLKTRRRTFYTTKHAEHLCLRAILMFSRAKVALTEAAASRLPCNDYGPPPKNLPHKPRGSLAFFLPASPMRSVP
jgi:hypothetical protein